MKLEKHKGANKLPDLEAVQRYIHTQDISLNTAQESLLHRLQFADEKIRSRKHTRDEIITALRTRFGVSQYRAERDITEAHSIFGQTRRLNKNYLMAQHLEDVARHIKLAESAKRLDLLPKLNDNYTYALNSLPTDNELNKHAPAKIIFIIKGDTDKQKTHDELLAEVDALLKKTTPNGDYIEFTEE
jgi:hypothetical protein